MVDFSSDAAFLEKNLPGRTITKVDLEKGEIHFDDMSVLILTWLPELSIGFELFEKPPTYYEDGESLSPEDAELVEKSWQKFKELTDTLKDEH